MKERLDAHATSIAAIAAVRTSLNCCLNRFKRSPFTGQSCLAAHWVTSHIRLRTLELSDFLLRSLPAEPERLPAAPVDVGNLDGLQPDLQDAVLPFDVLPVGPVVRPFPVAQHRNPRPVRLLHDADELE